MATEVSLNILDRIKVASPCHVRWEDMTPTTPGDEKVRHCAQCDLDVHDLSAMTREEADALINGHFTPDGMSRGKRLCGQWRRRADGTIIFRDCPVGLARVRARVRRSVVRALAMIGVTTLVTGAMARAQRGGWDVRRYGAFSMVSGWIGGNAAAQAAQTLSAGVGSRTYSGATGGIVDVDRLPAAQKKEIDEIIKNLDEVRERAERGQKQAEEKSVEETGPR